MSLAETKKEIWVSRENYRELEKMKNDLEKNLTSPTFDNVITVLLQSKKKTPFIVILKRGRFSCAGSIDVHYTNEVEKAFGKQFDIDFLFG